MYLWLKYTDVSNFHFEMYQKKKVIDKCIQEWTEQIQQKLTVESSW